MLSAPLRSRFSGGAFRLEFYTPEEVATIIKRSANILNINLEKEEIKNIADRSRQTPRIANYLLRRVRDYAQMNKSNINSETVRSAFEMLGLDEYGLGAQDVLLMKTIMEKFNNGPVGIKISLLPSEKTKVLSKMLWSHI